MARSARNIREVVEVDLGANLTRIFDDDDGTRVDAAHIDCWRSACRLLSTQSFEHKGNSVKLTTNWAPVLERVKDDTKNNRIFNHKREIAETANFDRSTVKMRFTVHTIISNPRERQGRPEYYVENFLYDVFLMINICAPAGINFSNATIFYDRFSSNNSLNLSNHLFDVAIINNRKENWPRISFLNFSQVFCWFSACRTILSQIPQSKVERALFAILHLCKSDTSLTTIIWIFYALESLFETKVGENLRMLVRRIVVFLELNSEQSKTLNKRLRELYDLRSGFVHGGLEVIHPANNEMLDPSINEHYVKLMDAADFGLHIILCCIQELVRRGWAEPIFEESIRGRPIGET